MNRPPKSREGSNPREALFRISSTEKSITRSHKRRKPRQKLHEIYPCRQKIIDFGMMFDAFAFGVSTFCVWISIGILMKKHRFWHRFCCFYLRRVDFFVWKTSSTSCTDFGISNWGSENFENWTKRPKSTQILILFFVASGTGKIVRDDFWSKTNAFSYFIFFFFGTSRWGSDMRRAEISEKNHIFVYKPKLTVSKIEHFWKWRLQSDDYMGTQSIF